MKKILLVAFLLMVVSQAIYAQCNPVVPGTNNVRQYILPDSATGLEPACITKPYEDTIFIKIFKDSSASLVIFGTPVPVTIKIDSFIINMDPVVMGLPSYLSMTTVPPIQPANSVNNYPHLKIAPILNDSLACIRLSGTVPTTAIPGNYPIKVILKGYADLFLQGTTTPLIADTSITDSVTAYSIKVQTLANCTQSIREVFSEFQNIQAVPNPVKNYLSLNMTVEKSKEYTINILSMTGSLIETRTITTNPGLNITHFDVNAFSAGSYFYTITDGQSRFTGKFAKD